MTTGSDTTFPLGDYACIQIDGEDAEAFLQGQLSNDVRAITPGEAQLSTFNDPQGRVVALLRVFRLPAAFVLALPAPLLEPVTRRLRMFLLRARASITAPAPWAISGRTGQPPAASPETPSLRLPGTAPLWNVLDRNGSPPRQTNSVDWAAREIRNGLPEIYPETAGRFVAQMLWLDRLGAVSFTKGCFVGQEVIARAHHLGRVKRHAHLFRSAEPGPAPGDAVMQDGSATGEVVRVAKDPVGHLILAVMKDGFGGGLHAADCPLEPLPDPDLFAD